MDEFVVFVGVEFCFCRRVDQSDAGLSFGFPCCLFCWFISCISLRVPFRPDYPCVQYEPLGDGGLPFVTFSGLFSVWDVFAPTFVHFAGDGLPPSKLFLLFIADDASLGEFEECLCSGRFWGIC